MKKLICLLLSLVLVAGCCITAFAVPPFSQHFGDFDEMKEYMLQEGRKALMDVVKGDRPYRSKARIGWI